MIIYVLIFIVFFLIFNLLNNNLLKEDFRNRYKNYILKNKKYSEIVKKNILNPNFQNNTNNKNYNEVFYVNNISVKGVPYMYGIDIIYWINSNNSIEKKTYMSNFFENKLFNNIEKIEINGFNEDIEINDIGFNILLSHLETIKKFSLTTDKYQIALILEDECALDFQQYWEKSIIEIVDNAPDDWEIIQLYYNSLNTSLLNWDNDINYVSYMSGKYTSCSYIINKKGAKNFMKKYYISNVDELHDYYKNFSDNYIYTFINTYYYKYPLICPGSISNEIIYENNLDNKNIIKKMIMNKYNIKNSYIPKNIFEVWHSKDLPPKMNKTVNNLINKNLDFNYYLYDENECIHFIKNNFSQNVLDAFNSMIPMAYKADLWRYCILYAYGGIYLDIKYRLENGYNFNNFIDKEYFVLERPNSNRMDVNEELKLINNPNYYLDINKHINSGLWENGKIGIYNGFMVCKRYNQILLECIKKITYNVENKIYGYSSIYITGPGLLGYEYFKNDYSKIKNIELFYGSDGQTIYYKDKVLFTYYPEYRDEQNKTSKTKYYSILWDERNIFK